MYILYVLFFYSVDDVWLYRGRDMSHLVSPLDKLFPLSKDGPGDGQGESGSATESIASWRTIGIGDGGNEVNHTLNYLVSLLNLYTVGYRYLPYFLQYHNTYTQMNVCMYIILLGSFTFLGPALSS